MLGARSEVFVGRADEVRDIRAILDRACSGEAGVVVISGDAGVGKTALVTQLLESPTEAIVLEGVCLPLSSFAIPLAPLRSALRRLPDGIPPPPTLLDGDRAVGLAPAALDEWLDQVCEASPVVLSIDDLQWADGHTLDVLMYLIAGRRDRRLAILATVRQTELGVGHPVNPWLAHVRRLPGFTQLRLGPLSQVETLEQLTALLGGPPHEDLVADVFRRTGGNAYLNRLLVSGLDPTTRRLPATLPDDLQGALIAGWHRLTPATRELTAVIALSGVRLAADELTKVVLPHLQVVSIQPLLDDAVAGHVLELAPDGTYWFHHPLQAEVLQFQLPRDERQRWHEVFATHLEAVLADHRDTETLIRLADHHFAADHPEDAFATALQAADAAEETAAYTEAIRLIRRAIRLLPQLHREDTSLLELLRRVRTSGEIAGDYAAEREAIDDLLAVLDPGDTAEIAWLRVRRIHLRQSLMEDFAPVDEIAEIVALGASTPHAWEYAYALAEQARIAVWTADPAAADLADHALTVAQEAHNPRALSYALTALAMVEVQVRGSAHAAPLTRRGRQAAADARDFWGYAHAVSWEANAVEVWSSHRYTDLHCEARLEAMALGAPAPFVNLIAVSEATSALAIGDWRRCSALLRTLLGSGLTPMVDVSARMTAARLTAFQGDLRTALAHLERAEEISSQLARFTPLQFSATTAEVQLEAGQPDAAALTALRAVRESGHGTTMSEWLVPLAARALADQQLHGRELGAESPRVRQELDELQERFPPPPYGTPTRPSILLDPVDTPLYRQQVEGLGLWYAAECGRAETRPGNGAEWQLASDTLSAASLPWEATYCGSRAAEAYLREERPDRHAAAAMLRSTAEAARELGARPILDQVERLARAARISLAAPTVVDHGGLAGLTRRENEILAHLVAGRTYREIAETLFLSEKTVSSHISNMLHKTGATNRVELARRAGERSGASVG